MQTIGAFLVLVFQLAVGPTQFDARNFAQLRGTWVVERAVSNGVDLPSEEWKGRTVIITDAEQKPDAGTAVLGGRLRTKGNMAWLETKTFSTSVEGSAEPVKIEHEFCTSFKVTGSTMKLFLAQVNSPTDRGPRPLEASKGEGGILLFLRKKK